MVCPAQLNGKGMPLLAVTTPMICAAKLCLRCSSEPLVAQDFGEALTDDAESNQDELHIRKFQFSFGR